MALHILLADDEREFVETLAERLGLRGHHVRVVYDGLSALAEMEKELPQVMVIDWMMPGLSGEEVLRKPLAVAGRYEIAQADGSLNVVRVADGAVWMEEANCRDGLCIRQGRMKNGAKTIVCLPHKVVVQIEGDTPQNEHSDLDVIIQ